PTAETAHLLDPCADPPPTPAPLLEDSPVATAPPDPPAPDPPEPDAPPAPVVDPLLVDPLLLLLEGAATTSIFTSSWPSGGPPWPGSPNQATLSSTTLKCSS